MVLLMAKVASETPLMQQHNAIKAKYPDAILLFRVGDFYETFGEDAITASKILDIVLTKRGNGSASETALAGFRCVRAKEGFGRGCDRIRQGLGLLVDSHTRKNTF